MPSSFTARMFAECKNMSYIPSTSGETRTIAGLGSGMFFVAVRINGSENEHWSLHVYVSSSPYAKSIFKIQEYNYNSNTSVTATAATSGTSGFNITANYTSINGSIRVFCYKMTIY